MITVLAFVLSNEYIGSIFHRLQLVFGSVTAVHLAIPTPFKSIIHIIGSHSSRSPRVILVFHPMSVNLRKLAKDLIPNDRLNAIVYLESELLEEPRDPVVEVLLPENFGSVVESGLLLGWVGKSLDDGIWLDLRPEVIILEDVPGQENVVGVDSLDEALDLGPLNKLFLGHVLGHLLWGLLDAENDTVRILALFCRLRIGNKDESLLAGVPTVEENHEASGGDELGLSRHSKGRLVRP